MKTKLALALSTVLLTVSCAATTPAAMSGQAATPAPAKESPIQAHTPAGDAITLEQIMADPDWLARSPQGAYWRYDGQGVIYQRKQEGSPVTEHYLVLPGQDLNGDQIPVSDLHQYAYQNGVYNADRSLLAYAFERNIFVLQVATGEVHQLTRDTANKTDLQFLNDGRISFRQGNDFYALDLNGRTEMVLSLATREAPEAVSEPKDLLEREEIELMEYNQVQRREAQQRFDARQQLQQANPAVAPEPFYLGNNVQVVEASLSPSGDKAIIATMPPMNWRGDSDVMPRYVTESGRIVNQDVRRRVADAQPVEHKLYLLDLNSGEKTELGFDTLPGFDEDVLKSVREENYAARGEAYESERKPRAIGVMARWSAQNGNINWNETGDQVAVMLRAWDNKDRWIATVDFDNGALQSQHRLHDEAWVNRDFNAFGWLPDQNALWYLSEEDNFSHLYVKDLGRENVRQLTSGHYLVDSVTLNAAGDMFYFQANKPHPGVYEIYRISVAGGEPEQLTELGGINTYVLSPDESSLLITHSSALQPPELFVQSVREHNPQQLTSTVSEAFNALPWAKPEIVPVPSSHVDEPIYSRVYKPADFDPEREEAYPAVVFIHGAGYLQNAHAGWSNYFREFMFHNKLLQQGYVVLDLDFRGSAGYGRDWRTAVYRQMGTPEVEDLVDVVNWMAEHANVNPKRVGTYGGSYGGFLTFMAMFNEPGLFQAGAALRPVTDWAHYNTGYTSNILNLPQDDEIAYKRSSPIYFAEGFTEGSLLISAPMVDSNVFFQDSVRLVQRLIELEKQNFETAIFPVEDHGFVQPSSWLNQYRKIYKLFESNLK